MRKILIIFLATIILVSYFPLRATRASSQIELSYEGPLKDRTGVASGLPWGNAILFTPPNGTYFLSQVKFCLTALINITNEDLANQLCVQIWDNNRVTLVNMTFHWGDFLDQIVTEDWITINVTTVIQVHGDFFICLSGHDKLILFLRYGDPLQDRSYIVSMLDNSIYAGMAEGLAIHAILSSLPPPIDLNVDGVIDIYDAMALASAFGSTPNSRNWNPKADLNNDGTVDIFDAIFLCSYFGQQL